MPYPDPSLTEEQQFIYELDRYLIDPNTKYTIVDYLLNNEIRTRHEISSMRGHL